MKLLPKTKTSMFAAVTYSNQMHSLGAQVGHLDIVFVMFYRAEVRHFLIDKHLRLYAANGLIAKWKCAKSKITDGQLVGFNRYDDGNCCMIKIGIYSFIAQDH